MASAGKILLSTGIGAGVIWLVSFLLGKKKLGDQLDSITSGAIHSLDTKGLTIRIDVVLKNPTQYSVKIKQPYVKLLLNNGTLIGSSQIVDKEIEIKPYGVQTIDPIYLNIPVTNLLSLGSTFYKALLNKQPIKLTVITMSIIDLDVKMIPYVKPTDITLNKQNPGAPASKANTPSLPGLMKGKIKTKKP